MPLERTDWIREFFMFVLIHWLVVFSSADD